MSADSPGRREVAHRLFAAEFEDADLSYSESDEERAPNYVVTPTGARVNRLFAVGVLTEVEHVNDDVLRGRVVDPSGAFVTYAGQYQPDPMTFLERTDPPTFVALSGKARTFQPDESDRVFTSVRPESINEVDAATRDRWVVGAARATLYRVAVFAEALTMDARGDDLRAALEAMGVREPVAAGVPVALDHYGTTPAYLDAVRRLAVDAIETVADERDAVRPLDAEPDAAGGGDVGPIPASVAPSLDRERAAAVASGTEPVAAGTDADASTASVTDENEDVAAEPAEAVESPDTEGQEAAEEAAEPEPATATESVEAADDSGTESEEPETGTGESAAATTDADASTASVTDENEDVAAEPAEAVESPDTEGQEAAEEAAEPEPATATESVEAADDSGTESEEPETGTGESAAATTDADASTASVTDENESVAAEPAEAVESPDTEGQEAAEEAAEPEPATAAESAAETESGGLGDFEDAGDEAGDLGDADGHANEDADEEVGDFEDAGMYELDEAERQEVEEEFGTEFSTGAEVDGPGEADIDVPDADELVEDETAAEPETDPDEADEDADDSADVDLEDAAVAAMEDLDDGDGADREAVVASVVDDVGADPDAVEDAIQDALMGGRCYEPSDGTLKAI